MSSEVLITSNMIFKITTCNSFLSFQNVFIFKTVEEQLVLKWHLFVHGMRTNIYKNHKNIISRNIDFDHGAGY